MTCEELKRIPLISIFKHLQIPCTKMNSREAWFKNPFNGGDERTASTKVDVHRNIWYSHSEGIGGNNIDFLIRFLGTPELAKVLEWADERKNILSFQQQTVLDSRHAVQTEKDTGYTILSVNVFCMLFTICTPSTSSTRSLHDSSPFLSEDVPKVPCSRRL